jgi:hypothetical protein
MTKMDFNSRALTAYLTNKVIFKLRLLRIAKIILVRYSQINANGGCIPQSGILKTSVKNATVIQSDISRNQH